MTEQALPEQSDSQERAVIGAIRLAIEAGAENGVRLKVIRALLALLPDTDPAAVEPVRLLIDAVRSVNAEFRVTDNQPRGRLVKAGSRS